ncbi:MAG TPA: hypothetical protein VGB24_12730 [Longimicrobium sp.]
MRWVPHGDTRARWTAQALSAAVTMDRASTSSWLGRSLPACFTSRLITLKKNAPAAM